MKDQCVDQKEHYFCNAMQRHDFFKKLVLPSLIFLCTAGAKADLERHPFFVSVTEIRLNSTQRSAEMSCRMFTDDLQEALYKLYGAKQELQQHDSRADALLQRYIGERIKCTVNGKVSAFRWVGYEIVEESVWCYFEADNCETTGLVEVENRLLYDFIKGQTNLVHCYRGAERQSAKLVCPESTCYFK